MSETATAGALPVRPHGVRQFWRYFTASTVSSVGDAVTSIALPLVAVGTLNASSFQVSLITAASYAAWILIGLPAGVIVQRLPLRGVQVAMDLARACALLSVPVAYAWGKLGLAQLIAVALVIGLASVVFDVGNSTFLPSIVSKEELTARNSLTSASIASTQLGGPSLGGILVQAFGAATTLLVDVVSYLVSAALLLSLPRAPAAAHDRAGASTVALIKDGWLYVARHEVMRSCAAVATLVNFTCGALMALTPVFLVRTVGAPVSLVGVLIATEGVGSLVGAALTTRLARRFGSARTLLAATLFTPTTLLLLPLATEGWGLALFALGNAGFAAGVVVLSILARTHRMTVAPPDLLPRVMATVRFVSWGAIPVGAVTAGIAATGLGNRGALWLACAFAFLCPLVLLTSPIRRLRELT
jgi:MFS family permease